MGISAVEKRSRRCTSPAKEYPGPGTVTMRRLPADRSPRILRSEKTFWVRLASLTNVPGQTFSISSFFSTTSPARSSRTSRIERAFGVIATGSSRCVRTRRRGSARKPSNSKTIRSFSSEP
jgi:hypothetical protein